MQTSAALAALAFGVIFFVLRAHAQEVDVAAQRTAMIGTLAQQLFQAEQMQHTLQTQLAQAQKSIADLKEKCGASCKDQPTQ